MRGYWKCLDLHGNVRTCGPLHPSSHGPGYMWAEEGRGAALWAGVGKLLLPIEPGWYWRCHWGAEYWNQTGMRRHAMHSCLDMHMENFILFFGSFPFDLWWCLHLARGYFLVHLFCLGSCQFGGLNCSIQGLGFFLYTDLLTCLKNLNRVGTWVLCRTLSYFLCHLFPGLILFWFYHFNLFPGHNCRAHWSKFPGLPIGLKKKYMFTIIIIL